MLNSCYIYTYIYMIQKVALGITLLVFMVSCISSPRFRNAQSYKLLGFFGNFVSQGLNITYLHT